MDNKLDSFGVVSHTSARGPIVVRVTDITRVGNRVFDGSGRLTGVVVDIFGPVDHPYLLVRPERGANLKAGDQLFLRKGQRGERRWRR